MPKACWTCRSRTIRCDASRTPCLKCEKAGLECFEKKPLRWVSGVAIRGKMRGQTYGAVSVSPDPSLSSDDGRFVQDKAYARAVMLGDQADPPRFALVDPRVQGLDWGVRFHVDYYSDQICKLYILHDSDTNPFRSLLPYALNNGSLLMAITALSARHIANAGHSFDRAGEALTSQRADAELAALQSKAQAIASLKAELALPEPCKKDTIMATILLLIFVELLESGLDGWNFHLKGAKGLSDLSQSLNRPVLSGHANNSSGEMAQDVRSFIVRQYSMYVHLPSIDVLSFPSTNRNRIDTLGSALSHPTPRLGETSSCEAIEGQESIVRSFLGCPEFILRSIQFFSNQRHLIAESPLHAKTATHTHIHDTLAMLELTQTFDSLKWASQFHPSTMSSPATEINNLFLLSEAYKTAALLYGRQVLTRTGAHMEHAETQALVSQLLGVIAALKAEDSFFKCLLWPTFVAGLHCLGLDQQDLVTGSLRRIWDLTKCLNVISAADILKKHWERVLASGTANPWTAGLAELDRHWLLI
ncbi:fungal-specific transcription factor domain-containing protein [Aspergillus carlsbadensis]|nr:fungal-specific transcription factor domain-containing protein [Aspergillus carlsbadensis]